MKKVYKDKIVNIVWTNRFDNKFSFEYINNIKVGNKENMKIIFLADLLEERKNLEMLEKSKIKPATYCNVYSPKDELEIFKKLFDNSIKNNQKIHIVWITLREEIEILEDYYNKLWFFDKTINCFSVDFNIPLVTVSVNIENLIWKWSDYKRMRDKIFFNPPIRESGQTKAMFKWINRWVIAWINLWDCNKEKQDFLSNCIINEKILAITLAKVLKYNLKDIGFDWEKKELVTGY